MDFDNRPLMKCGCVANGVCNRWQGTDYDPPIPCCIIHDCLEIAPEQPSLEGRTAKCAYGCGIEKPSSLELAFFEYRSALPFDAFYCGCRGWD